MEAHGVGAAEGASEGAAATPSSAPIVCSVLVAEFDIDKGSLLRQVWPEPRDVDMPFPGWSRGNLAEAMLPEGLHHRRSEDDWTAFIINRDGASQSMTDSGLAWSQPKDGATMLFGFSCVRTQLDTSVRRGAKVCAVAVVTPHSFLMGFQVRVASLWCAPVRSVCASLLESCLTMQDILHLALDAYMATPGTSVLQRVYDCVNGADRAPIAGALSPTQPTAAIPLRVQLAWRRRAERATVPLRHCSVGSVLYGPESTPHSVALQVRWSESVTVGIPIPLGDERTYRRTALGHVFPPCSHVVTAAVSQANASLAELVGVFGSKTAIIYDAVLTGKRVLFVGHKSMAAGDVCRMVFSACSLVSPPMVGVLRRAFPYCSLTDLSFLNVEGWVLCVLAPVLVCLPDPMHVPSSTQIHRRCHQPGVQGSNCVVGCSRRFAHPGRGCIRGKCPREAASPSAASSVARTSR